MKVAVKKRVLFNLLKNRLNENRMQGGDMGGRVIHPFNIQSPNSDPFGFYEDEEDTPIKVSDHMSVQLSVPKMPVEDEDFVPSTITELCNSATLICKEVPLTQIEYFYRQLHMLLDRALDRNDERGLDVVNETFEISKQTTIKDFNIITESSRIRRKTNTPIDGQDSDAYREAENKEAYLDGYRMGTTDANPSPERAEQLSMGSQDFINGYMQALREDEVDIESDIDTVLDPDFDRPMFPSQPGETKFGSGKPMFDSYEQFLARGTEIDATGNVDTSAYDSASPQEKASMDASAAMQEVFKEIHTEATAIMMDPKMAKEFGALMTPVTQEFGLSSSEVLTPLNVGRMFAYVNKMKDQTKKLAKIQELQMKLFVVISEALDKVLKRKPRVRKNIQSLAAEANIPFEQFMVQIKQDIAGAYTQYGATSRVAMEGGDAAVVSKKINDLFAVFIKTLKLPGTDNKFKNRTHFYGNVDINSLEEILDGFKAVVDSQFKDKSNPDLYVVRDRDVTVGLTEEEMMEAVETLVNLEFENAEEVQRGPETSIDGDIDASDEKTDEIVEIEAEAYMSALEEFAARHAQGKKVDFQDLAPYFGYTGTAGMRQYVLKDIMPKLEAMTFTDADDNPSNVGDLMDYNAEVLVDQMLVVINKPKGGLIEKYEKLVAKGKIKKRTVNAKNKVQHVGTVEILNALKEQIVPVLETLQRLFNQGEKYTNIAADANHPAHELLNLVGGYVFREVNMAPITAVYNTMRSDLSDAIADSIIARVGEGKVSRQAITEKGGIAEYFTGLKTKPDYTAPPTSKKGKIVQKLIDIGLTPEVFAEVLIDAEETWQDGILDKLQDFDGAIYKEAIEDAVDDLTDNPANLMKAIEAGIKATAQEKVYQNLERQTR